MGDTRPWRTLASRASMPWLETAPVDERERFIADYRLDLYTMADLCARYNVSRKTGYKWIDRMEEGGRAALRDRSRAPHHCPHRIAADVAERICAARQAHPSWGPRMLLQWLERRAPNVDWPAPSTAGDLLVGRGLVKKRRRRRPHYHPGVVAPVTHGAQRPVDRRLQGPLPDPRRSVLLSAHDRG